MVVFCWSTASRLKALIGPPALLLVPLLVGNKLQCCYSCLFSVLKALDEVYKVAETGEKAVKNVANQATAWGKSFGQWRCTTNIFVNYFLPLVLLNKEKASTPPGWHAFLWLCLVKPHHEPWVRSECWGLKLHPAANRQTLWGFVRQGVARSGHSFDFGEGLESWSLPLGCWAQVLMRVSQDEHPAHYSRWGKILRVSATVLLGLPVSLQLAAGLMKAGVAPAVVRDVLCSR